MIMWIFSNTNPNWLLIVAFSYSPGSVDEKHLIPHFQRKTFVFKFLRGSEDKNIWCVFRETVVRFFFFLTTTTASSSGEVWTVGLTVEIKAVFSNFFRPWCGRSLGSGCTPDRWTPDRDRFEAWDRKASVFCGLESFLLHAYVLRWKNT